MKKLLSILLISIVFISCTRVDSGNEALRVDQFGNDKGEAVAVEVRGTVFYNPWSQDIFEYPTYMQHVAYEGVTFTTKDGSVFTSAPNFNYSMKVGRAVNVFTKFRKDISEIESTYMMSSVQDAYVRIGNTFNADSLMANRALFEDKMMQELVNKLGDDFIVSQLVSNMNPPPSLVEAINTKNQLVQEGLAEQNKVVKATAAANVRIENARGLAESMKITADGEAYANTKRQSTLTDKLLQQQFIERWDGVLPVYGQVPTLFKNMQ